MKILIDTNIVLDHLLDRPHFNTSAAWIFSATERGELTTLIGATTVTTVHYLVTKAAGAKAGKQSIGLILQLFEVAPVNRMVLASALDLGFDDFEDAVLHEAALHAGVEALITRDMKGFARSVLPVYAPDKFILSLAALV